MQNLVKRYVTKEQRRIDERMVKEDDINEVKQDISSFKYEILNILRMNSWNTGTAHEKQECELVGVPGSPFYIHYLTLVDFLSAACLNHISHLISTI